MVTVQQTQTHFSPPTSLKVKPQHLLTAVAGGGHQEGSPFRLQPDSPDHHSGVLFLKFAMDKLYYSLLGKFMDERDVAIREKLSSVKDTLAEVKQLEEQGSAMMKSARAEISVALKPLIVFSAEVRNLSDFTLNPANLYRVCR